MAVVKRAVKEVGSMLAERRLPRWDNVLEDAAQVSTILIVDDRDLNRRLLKGILKTEPYRILEAKRPSLALQLLENEKVDLVVMDMVMPGMSGPDFCRALKANRHTQLIPLLVITGVQGTENGSPASNPAPTISGEAATARGSANTGPRDAAQQGSSIHWTRPSSSRGEVGGGARQLYRMH
jgi:CheY-like chemotaxis protein